MNTLTKIPNNFSILLEKITKTIEDNLSKSFTENTSKFKIKEVILHPGREGSETKYKKLKKFLENNKAVALCAGIYTLISNVTEVKAIESEQADVTLQLSAYCLIVSRNSTLEDRLAFNLLTRIINIINNNRWKLNYTFPASNLKRVDLYGLTVEAKQITGIKGWNPSIQAHAKDLYEDGSGTHPKELTLSLVSWDQGLRIKENIFDSEKASVNKFIFNNKVN